MKRLILALLVSSTFSLHADEYATMLKKNRDAVSRQLTRIDADSRKSLEAWPAQYLQSLNTLEEKFKTTGELEGVLAARKEKDRFTGTKQIPQEAVVETPQELHDLQTQSLEAQKHIDTKRNKQIVGLMEQYLSILDDFKKTLTKKGKLDQAIEINEEMESLKARPEVIAAKLALETAATQAKPEEKPAMKDPPIRKGETQ